MHFRDIRILLFNPIDFRGIPVPDQPCEFTLWLKPLIFNLEESENVINIIFLDELTSAPLSLQAAAYQLTQDKRIGEHVMPTNTIIVAAGNRVSDKGVAHKMATPLADRMQHYEIVSESDIIWDSKSHMIGCNIMKLSPMLNHGKHGHSTTKSLKK